MIQARAETQTVGGWRSRGLVLALTEHLEKWRRRSRSILRELE
jgi:hypothetical protein